MRVEKYPLGMMQTNCYVIYNKNNEAAVVDPGDEGERLFRTITDKGATVTKVLLTHGHFDHIGGGGFIQDKTGCEVYIHELDNEYLQDPFKVLSAASRQFISSEFKQPKATKLFSDGDTIEHGEITFKCMHTPGHTKGSTMLFAGDIIFSGDTIFRMEIGRNDLYGGSPSQQVESLKRIAKIEGDYKICPGHDMDTTLEFEKQHNPYLKRYT